jgi:hypothetical protein
MMSGILGKMKDRWEDQKVKQIQKLIEKNFDNFKRGYEKTLRKLGLTLEYAGSLGTDARARKGGLCLAKFNDKEGHQVTLVQSQEVYERGGTRTVYWGPSIWSTIVSGSTPFTLLFKEFEGGFMKKSTRVFLPFTSPQFNEKELLNSPLLQTAVVAALNSNKSVCDNIAKLSLKCSVPLGYKSWLKTSCSDLAGKCTIVPAGDETAVFLRDYGGGTPELILETMAGIRNIILAHPHTERIIGSIPAQWINTVYSLCKAKSLEGTEAPSSPQ